MKIIFALILTLLIVGCIEQRTTVSNRKNFEYNDLNDSVKNEQHCSELCKNRESESRINGQYRCDYEPVICSNGKCLCKTY